jgi:tetratricopeptide (TPR) repeat protein
MRNRPVNLKHTVAAIGPLLLLCGSGWAEVAPPELLEKLRQAAPAQAGRIAKEVTRYWARSGSAAMDLLLERGRRAMEQGNFPLAIEHFTALTDHAPDFAEGYHARAEAYFRSNLYGPALADLEQALALNPNHFEAIFGFAVMVQEFGDPRRAAELYRRVLAIHPNHENAQTALSRLKRDGIGREL